MSWYFRDSPACGPAASFHQISRFFAHLPHAPEIAKQFNPRHAHVLGTFHLNGRPRRNKARGDVRKILHRRAKNRNLAERRWFQNVMAAGRDKRATHKSAVRQSIKRRQFPDTIKQKNGHIARYRGISRVAVSTGRGLTRVRNWQGGSPYKLAVRFLDEFRCRGKLLWLSRRKDQKRVAIFALQSSKGNQRKRLFRGYHTSGNDDGRAAAAPDLRFEPIRERRRRRQLRVVFQVAADGNAVAGRSQRADSLGILVALHQEGACLRERIL